MSRIKPFYVVRLTRNDGGVVYWTSESDPMTPDISEATVFRSAQAVTDTAGTVRKRVPPTTRVESLTVPLEDIL